MRREWALKIVLVVVGLLLVRVDPTGALAAGEAACQNLLPMNQ